jgi:hypothetical protein
MERGEELVYNGGGTASHRVKVRRNNKILTGELSGE